MNQSRIAFNVNNVSVQIEKAIENDSTMLHTIDSTNVASLSNMDFSMIPKPSVSGSANNDYLQFSQLANGFKDLVQIKTLSKSCLPSQIVQNSNQAHCNYMMGIFPEIRRAWLTIDQDIYVWCYEQGTDVAYYDGISEMIIGVGLVKPKPGVFKSFIKYLLVLTTTMEIIVLGVTFSKTEVAPGGPQMEEMHLVPDPIFQISSDEVPMNVVVGSTNGRIFLGGRDGCLYEIGYQGETRWFGKRCKKLNHSTGLISYILPSFINNVFYEDDFILQIVIDNSRNILYTLSEKGAIEVYDMGHDGQSMSRIAKLSQSSYNQLAQQIENTIESVNLKQVTNVSAIEKNESKVIHLVGTTQAGLRFYFTTYDQNYTTNGQEMEFVRPTCLKLIHVRLPPGFSTNFRSILPKNVYLSHYKQSNFLFVSKTANEQHSLWCINSDPFPPNSVLSEAFTSIALDGPVWDIAEVQSKSNLFANQSLPPLVVRQHIEPPRKFVILTSQSVYIVLKSRPIDFLRQLLLDNKGPDNASVKAYFQLQGEEQACAISLVLACLESVQNQDIADWATRAFLLYGSQTKQSNVQNTWISNSVSQFMPNLVSTPASEAQNRFQQQFQQQQNQQLQNMSTTLQNPEECKQFSAKHNGLYLYASRILRPLWNRFCVQTVIQEGSKVEYVVSSVNIDDFNLILSNLLSLKSFLSKYTQLKPHRELQQVVTFNKTLNTSSVIADKTLIEQQMEESKSVQNLYDFIVHCTEVISLWKVLNEHQFSTLINSLSQDYRLTLFSTTFKDLFLYGHNVCSTLIINLINSYLKIGASIDLINSKLREVCPKLYKSEDAISSKASQMLISAKSKINLDEKDELLKQALSMYKEVAPNINLTMAVQKFVSSEYYFGVIDLSVDCAVKTDPENLSSRFYKNGEPENDRQGYSAYMNKLNIYKEVVQMLDDLFNRIVGPDNAEMLKAVLKIVSMALNYEDVILHISVYDWMLKKNLYSELIAIKNDSLETFLLKAKDQNPDSIELCDLLWKFYEKKSNHSQATVILKGLAHSTSPNVDLAKRIEYLSRAIMCARSCQSAFLAQCGIHARDLEEEIELARTQKLILESIQRLPIPEPDLKEITQRLNSELLDLTQLYNDYAEPFNLWECKLALISYSTNIDPVAVKQIWSNILASEKMKFESNDDNEKLALVLDKIRDLHKIYVASDICFPLDFILLDIEIWSCNLKADVRLVPYSFFKMGIKPDLLITAYYQMFVLSPDAWASSESNFHLFNSFVELLSLIKTEIRSFLTSDRLKIIGKAEDTILSMLSYLYSKPNTEEIVQKIRKIRLEFGAC